MPKYTKGKTIQQIRTAVEATIKQLPTIAGTEAVNHFKQSFRNEGFTDSTLHKWKPRKRSDPGRGILTKTGKLRRAIKVLEKTPRSVLVGVNLSEVPYAQVHNDGFRGRVSVKGHTRRGKPVKAGNRRMNIPKRQFVGKSKVLDDKITKKTAAVLKAALS